MRYSLILLFMLSGCTDSVGAKKALEGAGYTDVKTLGYSLLSCSEDDIYKTKFDAVGPTGKNVSGVVCAGIFKGSTIRTN